jgi:hypothetical protein
MHGKTTIKKTSIFAIVNVNVIVVLMSSGFVTDPVLRIVALEGHSFVKYASDENF